jgi:hypothetical protein
MLLKYILLPSLKKAKQQARGVICVSNLKQWGVIIEMYTQPNDGWLHGEHGMFLNRRHTYEELEVKT